MALTLGLPNTLVSNTLKGIPSPTFEKPQLGLGIYVYHTVTRYSLSHDDFVSSVRHDIFHRPMTWNRRELHFSFSCLIGKTDWTDGKTTDCSYISVIDLYFNQPSFWIFKGYWGLDIVNLINLSYKVPTYIHSIRKCPWNTSCEI